MQCGEDGVGRGKNESIVYRAIFERLAEQGIGKGRLQRLRCGLRRSPRVGGSSWLRRGKKM